MAQLMSIKRNVEMCPGQVSVPAIYHVSQGDKGTRIILGLVNNSANYTIPDGTTATIRGHRADGTLFTEITADVETTEVKFNLTEDMSAVPGRAECEAVLASGSANIIGTANFIIDVEKSPASVGSVIPGTDAAETWLIDELTNLDISGLDNESVVDAINSKANESTIAPEFDTSTSYTAGSYVLKNGVLYRFTSNHSGAWTGTDAEVVTVGGEVTDLKADLSDYSEGYYLTQMPETLAKLYFNISTGTYSEMNTRLTYKGGFNTFGAKLIDVEITEGYAWNIYFSNVSNGVYTLVEPYSTRWITETRRMISIPSEANRIFIACVKTDGSEFTDAEKTNVFKIMVRGAKELDIIDYTESTDMHTEYYGYYQYIDTLPPQAPLYNRLTQDRIYKIGDYKLIGFIPKSGYSTVVNLFDKNLNRLGNNGFWISRKWMICLIANYPNAEYFKITYKRANEENMNESDYNAFSTYAPNVKSILPTLSKVGLTFIDFYTYNSGDLAVYNGNLFFAGGQGLYINGIEVSASVGHGNNIMFGKTLDGEFPHLYSGSWYKGQKNVYVNRVTLTSSELVKTITYNDLPTGFLNMCVDEPNERVYIFMEIGEDTYQGNILFAVGDFEGNILTSKNLDVTIPVIQGLTFDDGLCYLTSGNGSEYPNHLYTFDTDGNLIAKSMVSILGEIEGITVIDDGTIYIKALGSLYCL